MFSKLTASDLYFLLMFSGFGIYWLLDNLIDSIRDRKESELQIEQEKTIQKKIDAGVYDKEYD